MSVSNFLSWTAHLVWSPTSSEKTEVYLNNSRSRNINVSDHQNSSGQTISTRGPPHHQNSTGNPSNLPGPAGAKAMPWECTVTVTVGMARIDWAVRDKRSWNKSCGPHRQIRRYCSNADMNTTCMTLLEHCRRPSTPNRPSHCSTASVSRHFFAHCVLQSPKVSWTQEVAFSKAMRCTETGRSNSCMGSRNSSCKNDSRSGKQQQQQP